MDLTTTYMGLTLKHPVVPSASPLSKSISGIRQMEDAGAAAITMYSLFEEQIDMEALALHHFIEQATFVSAEATAYYPQTGRLQPRPGWLPGADPPGQGGRERAGHRQPERRHAGRLGRVCHARSSRPAPTRWS